MTALPAKSAFTDADVTEGTFKTSLDNLRDYLAERVPGLKSNTALSDASATLTAAQLVGGEFTITPTAARTQTTDTAVNIIAAMAGSTDGSSFEFTVINLADFAVTIALGTGVTLVGGMAVNAGSATFRVRRLTSTTASVTRLESQSKLDTLSSPIAAAANHIRLGREYLIDGTITTSTSDVAATATEDTFRTYGKTGASTVLSSMNTYVPSEATGVILDVQLGVTAQSGNNAVLSFNACSADLSPIAGDSNRVGFANAYESSAPSGALTRSGSMTRVVVPLNSSGIFKATFKQTTTYERSCVIYYRGYVTD